MMRKIKVTLFYNIKGKYIKNVRPANHFEGLTHKIILLSNI